MQFDELYKFLGYGLVCLLIFYIVSKSIRFQLGIIEGLVGIKKDKKTTDQAKDEDDDDDEDEDEDEDDEDDEDDDQPDQSEMDYD